MQFWTGGAGLAKLRTNPVSLANAYESWAADAANAERLGFDGFGAAEHHFMYDGFMPLPLQALAAASATTSRIRLVTSAMLLPLYDPLEAAEQAATLDVLCRGRVTLGLGMGYRPLEFDGLGTAKRTRGARLVEAMEVLRLATSHEEFSYQGQHYRYRGARVGPRSVQRPVDLWLCSGTSPRGAQRAGQAGLKYWLANAPYEHAESMVKEYRRVAHEAGWPEERLGVAVFKDVCIGETLADAEGFRRTLMESFYDEHILGYGYLVDDRGRHLYNPPLDHPIYRRFVSSLFCGTRDMVIEELMRYRRLGVQAMFLSSWQRELLASRILPELR